MSLWPLGVETLVFLGGLQNIDKDVSEAADPESPRGWHKLVWITIPLITPMILFNLIIGIIYSFQVFTQALVIGGTTGKPAEATVLFVVVLVMTLLIFRLPGPGSIARGTAVDQTPHSARQTGPVADLSRHHAGHRGGVLAAVLLDGNLCRGGVHRQSRDEPDAGHAGTGGITLASGRSLGGRTGTGEAVMLGIRPDRVSPAPVEGADEVGRVTLVGHLGDETILHLKGDAALTMKLPGDVTARTGDAVRARFDQTGCCLFGADGRVLAGE